MVINTNIEAQATTNNLNVSQAMLAKSLARLSSGSKIIVPSDDAAGLAVSSRLNSQIKRLDSALNNVINAVSFTQTQDGFMKTIDKAYRRMGELAILAQDTTKSDADRALYNQEFAQLKSYVGETSKQDFNGVSLFGGALLDVTVDADGTTFSMVGIDLIDNTYTNAINTGTQAWQITEGQSVWKVTKDGYTTSNTVYKSSVDLWRTASSGGAGTWSTTDTGGTKFDAGTYVVEDISTTDSAATSHVKGTYVATGKETVAVISGFKLDVEDNILELGEDHGLASGDAVKLSGTAPGGTDTATTYYVNASGQNITLHKAKVDASAGTNAVNLTDSAISNTLTGGSTVDDTPGAAVATDYYFKFTAHGLDTGDKVRLTDASSSSANTTTDYFVTKIDADNITLHTGITDAVAIADGNRVSTTAAIGISLEHSTIGGITATAATDTYTKANHGLKTGQEIQITEKGTAVAAGKTYTTYYADNAGDNDFKLWTKHHTGVSASDSANTLTFAAGHGLVDQDAIRFDTTAPDGTVTTKVYYVAVTGDAATLHNTAADAGAVSTANTVQITADASNLKVYGTYVPVAADSATNVRMHVNTSSSTFTVNDYSVSVNSTTAAAISTNEYVSIDPTATGNNEDAVAVKVDGPESINSSQDLSAVATQLGADYTDVNLKSVASSQIALSLVKLAITQVATDRARLGAVQSRLNFTNEQLTVTKENLSAAISRIADVDVAEEATSYARYQILVQSGVEMLKQANQLPQSALNLLR